MSLIKNSFSGKFFYFILFSFLLVSVLLSLFYGLPHEQAQLVLYELRLPRMLTAMGAGLVLSLSGMLLQRVFFNPLAEPYTLGVASGAALGAAGVASFGFSLVLGSWLGASLVFILLALFLKNTSRSSEQVLLMGVMINVFCSSLLAIWMSLGNPHQIRSLNFWLLGDLSRATYFQALILIVCGLFMLIWSFFKNTVLDSFLFGPTMVSTFGVDRNTVQKQVVLLTIFSVAFVVGFSGVIGFLGLIAPHAVEKFFGPKINQKVLAVSIFGMGLLVFADFVSRFISYPNEMPIGAVTAVLGAPVLVLILRGQHA